MLSRATGRVMGSLRRCASLAQMLNRSPATIHALLERLKAQGVVDWAQGRQRTLRLCDGTSHRLSDQSSRLGATPVA